MRPSALKSHWTASGSRWHRGCHAAEDIWDHEAARRYDTPGTGMFSPEVLGPAVDRLAELAGDGCAQVTWTTDGIHRHAPLASLP